MVAKSYFPRQLEVFRRRARYALGTNGRPPIGRLAGLWHSARWKTRAGRFRATDKAIGRLTRDTILMIGFAKDSTVVATPEGSVRWRFAGYGRGSRISDHPCARMTARANRLSYHRGAVTEWYVNDKRGLEQGFTIARRLRGSGPIVVTLSIDDGVLVLAAAENTVHLVRNRQTLLRYGGLKAWDAHGRVLDSVLEVRLSQIRLIVDDANAHYPITIDPWVQSTKLTALDRAAGDYAGYSVAATESTAVVWEPTARTDLLARLMSMQETVQAGCNRPSSRRQTDCRTLTSGFLLP